MKKKQTKGTIFILLLLLVLGLGGFYLTQHSELLASTQIVEQQQTETFQEQKKAETIEESVDKKLEMSKKMVMKIIAKKEEMEKKQDIARKSEEQYKADMEVANKAVQEYNDTLEASKIYGAGALEIFFEVGSDRGMFVKATTTIYESN